MSDHQILMWFFGVCAVIWVVQHLARAHERAAERANQPTRALPNSILCDTPSDLEETKREILRVLSEYLGESEARLTADTRFHDDLRVPPGEFIALLEKIELLFKIAIDHERIGTVGDILRLVELHPGEDEEVQET